MATPPFARVLVVGTGMIGGSVAGRIRLSRPGTEVVGLDPDERGARMLVERGLLDRAAPPDRLAPEVAAADLVVLAAPPAAIVDLLPRVAAALGPEAIATDVASVKGRILQEARRLFPAGRDRFVGGHPLAGTEKRGPTHADPDALDGAVWCLVPFGDESDPALRRLAPFLTGCGVRPVVLDAASHDRTVALTSHLPHVLAFSLALAAGSAAAELPHLPDLVGRSFRDATRVAASDPALWDQILRANRPAVREALDRFRQALSAAEAALAEGDLAGFLRRAGESARRCRPGVEG